LAGIGAGLQTGLWQWTKCRGKSCHLGMAGPIRSQNNIVSGISEFATLGAEIFRNRYKLFGCEFAPVHE
jgi:hypothetical protein